MSRSDGGATTLLGLFNDEVARLERRLRGLSAAAWRPRADTVRAALVEIVAIDADLRGETPHRLPAVAEYALADALVVIAGDFLEATVGADHSHQVSTALSVVRSTIELTR